MKLSELLGMNLSEFKTLGIFDVDFLEDTPLFVNLENYRTFSGVDNVVNIFANNVICASRDNMLNEVEGFGLGFSKTEKDGNGPAKNIVDKAIEMSSNFTGGISNIQYYIPILDGFGPDALSDLMLIGLKSELFEESNNLIEGIRDLVSNSNYELSITSNMAGDKVVRWNHNNKSYARKLIKKSYLANFNNIEKVRNKAKSWFGYEESSPKHQFAASLISADFNDETIKIIKLIQIASSLSQRGAMEFSQKYYENQIPENDLEYGEKVLDFFHKSNRKSIVIHGDKENINKNPEKDYQNGQEMSLVTSSFSSQYERESERGRGEVDFVIKKDNNIVIIEDKVEPFTNSNLISAINQVNNYAADPAYDGMNKRKVVIFFTTSFSFENRMNVITEIRSTIPEFSGIEVMIYRGSPVASTGAAIITSHRETI